jgi:hypothetical protein
MRVPVAPDVKDRRSAKLFLPTFETKVRLVSLRFFLRPQFVRQFGFDLLNGRQTRLELFREGFHSAIRSRIRTLWPHWICATSCCTIVRSGHASAKARIYLMLRPENPAISGNARRKSAESRSITREPQPSRCCCVNIACPISQYNATSCALTARAAFTCAARILPGPPGFWRNRRACRDASKGAIRWNRHARAVIPRGLLPGRGCLILPTSPSAAASPAA